MKLACLPEIAALMAANGRAFIENRNRLSVQTIGDCYVISRNRFNRWMRLISSYSEPPRATPGNPRETRPALHPLVDLAQNVLLNEVAARVWLALLVAGDRFHRRNDTEALAKNLISGYQTVHRRTMEGVMHSESIAARQRRELQDLRKDTEIWTDLLCCDVMSHYDLWTLAFNPEDARHSCQQRLRGGFPSPENAAWRRLLIELRAAFSTVSGSSPVQHIEDRQLLRLMLSTFPSSVGHTNLLLGSSV